MANALTISANLAATILGQQFPGAATATIAPAGNGAIKENQSIATAATQVSLSGITSPAYVLIQNLDTTNTVAVSLETTAAVTPQTLQPNGGFCILTGLGASPVYAKANTAAVEISVTAISI